MTTIQQTPETLVSNNGVVLKVSSSLISKVLGEPELSEYEEEYYWEVDGRLIVGQSYYRNDMEYHVIYSNSKLKDMSFCTQLVRSINALLDRPEYNFSVDLKGRLTIFELK